MPKESVNNSEPIVRDATLRDARSIYALIKSNPEELMVRPLADIARNIDRFVVVTVKGKTAGCASYTIMPEAGNFSKATVELRSVAIRKSMRRRGLGKVLVDALTKRIAHLSPEQIFVMTYTPEFFAKLGFVKIEKSTIMHKIYTGCMNCTKHSNPFTCPEVAMALPTGATRRLD